jgi:prefoldin subunit 5
VPKYESVNNLNSKPANDIDNIIKNVHNKISVEDDIDNRIETLSVSDEEITSIIEDTADIQILKKSTQNKGGNNRTLNI